MLFKRNVRRRYNIHETQRHIYIFIYVRSNKMFSSFFIFLYFNFNKIVKEFPTQFVHKGKPVITYN